MSTQCKDKVRKGKLAPVARLSNNVSTKGELLATIYHIHISVRNAVRGQGVGWGGHWGHVPSNIVTEGLQVALIIVVPLQTKWNFQTVKITKGRALAIII